MAFVKIREIKIKSSGHLGTVVGITALLNIDTPTSAKITIEDPNGTEKITQVAMTKEANRVYTYNYQSDDDDNDGTYTVIIEISDDTNTCMEKGEFDLSDITLQWSGQH